MLAGSLLCGIVVRCRAPAFRLKASQVRRSFLCLHFYTAFDAAWLSHSESCCCRARRRVRETRCWRQTWRKNETQKGNVCDTRPSTSARPGHDLATCSSRLHGPWTHAIGRRSCPAGRQPSADRAEAVQVFGVGRLEDIGHCWLSSPEHVTWGEAGAGPRRAPPRWTGRRGGDSASEHEERSHRCRRAGSGSPSLQLPHIAVPISPPARDFSVSASLQWFERSAQQVVRTSNILVGIRVDGAPRTRRPAPLNTRLRLGRTAPQLHRRRLAADSCVGFAPRWGSAFSCLDWDTVVRGD